LLALVVVPAIAQVGQELGNLGNDAESEIVEVNNAESEEVDQEFAVSNEGGHTKQCVAATRSATPATSRTP
jgi:hypothetical protein